MDRSALLAIIPVTSWILGGITRIIRGLRGNLLTLIIGILQLVIPPVTFVFWIIDIVTSILHGDLTVCA